MKFIKKLLRGLGYLLLAWVVVGIVYAALGYYREPIAREGAKAFCEGVRVGQSPTGLLEQALEKGADEYQTRWREMVRGKRQLSAVFVGLPPFSRYICVVEAEGESVVSTRTLYLD